MDPINISVVIILIMNRMDEATDNRITEMFVTEMTYIIMHC